jgi:Flp pilus assembly protein TadD
VTQGPKYKIDFKGMTPEGDLRKMALATAKLKKIAPNEALELIKTKHFCLIKNLNEDKSEKLYKLLRSYGANVTLTRTDVAESGPQHEVKNYSRRRIHAIFFTILAFIVMLTLFLFVGKLANEDQGPGSKSMVKKIKESVLGPEVYVASDYITEAIKVIEASKSRLQKSGWKDYGQKQPGSTGFLPEEEFDLALKYLNKAGRENSKDERVEQWKAQLFELNGQKRKAEESYKYGLNKNPNNIYLRNDYAAFLTQEEMYSKAEYQYRKAISIDPTNPESHKNIGVLYQFYLDDNKKAKKHYYKYAVNSTPKDVQRYLVLKELSMLGWNDFHEDGYPKKGESSLTYDEYEPKRSSLERKRAIAPKDPSLILSQSRLYAQKGMHELALKQLRTIEKEDLVQNDVLKEKAKINMALENIEQAYRELSKADSKKLKDPDFIASLALLEKYYKLDSKKTEKLLANYLKTGGRDKQFVNELLSTGE